MKIVLVGNYTAFWHEAAWVRALRELGHEVYPLEIVKQFRSPIEKLQFRFKYGPRVRWVNNYIKKTVYEIQPDIVICYRTLTLYVSTVDAIRRNSSSLLVCYNNDNAFSPRARLRTWRYFREAIPHYHLHLVFRHSDIPNYKKAGVESVYMLRHHYLPWLHKKVDLNDKDRSFWKSDIGFFGHCEPDIRLEQMASLMQRVPAKYRLHGSNWDKHSKGRPWRGMDTHEIQGEEYVKGISTTKIALCFLSRFQNLDTYTTRCFEIPACGTMMLSQRTDDLLTLYDEDKEAVFFDSVDELIDKASFYLRNDDLRREIAEAGWKRCMSSGYDIHSRMREWIAIVEMMLK